MHKIKLSKGVFLYDNIKYNPKFAKLGIETDTLTKPNAIVIKSKSKRVNDRMDYFIIQALQFLNNTDLDNTHVFIMLRSNDRNMIQIIEGSYSDEFDLVTDGNWAIYKRI